MYVVSNLMSVLIPCPFNLTGILPLCKHVVAEQNRTEHIFINSQIVQYNI